MKLRVSLLVFVSILLFVKFASAEVIMIPDQKSITILEGETKKINIAIKNFEQQDIIATYSYANPSPSQLSIAFDRNPPITLQAGKEFRLTLYLTVLKGATPGTKLLTIELKNLATSEILDSINLLLRISTKSKVYISDVALNKKIFEPGEALELRTIVVNGGTKSYENLRLEINIVYKENLIKKLESLISSLAPGETRTITKTFNITNLLKPGKYDLKILLKDKYGNLVFERADSFEIKEVSNKIKISKQKTFAIFSNKYVVVVRNEGNVETPVQVKEVISIIDPSLFSSSVPPTSIEKIGNNYVAIWNFTLKPGEQKIIEYEVKLYPYWIFGIVVIIVVLFIVSRWSVLLVVKSHSFRGKLTRKAEIPIIIEVKNKFVRSVSDIEVKEFVPGIFQLVEKFDTITPKVKKAKEGLYLIWKIGKMNPGEERVLTYRIKPKLDIEGEVILPNTQVSYTDWRGKKKTILSNIAKIK